MAGDRTVPRQRDEKRVMKRRSVSPWTWQDQMGFAQASEVSGEWRVLVCSGQGSVDEEGHPLHAGDMRAQVSRTMDNLEAVLREAGMGLSDFVVRLNYYTTNVDAFFGAMDLIAARMEGTGPLPRCWA